MRATAAAVVVLPRRKARPAKRNRAGGESRGLKRDSAHRPAPTAEPPKLPYVLDFYPLENSSQTRLSAFFEALRQGRFTTTRCRKDGKILWPPRTVCPLCHTADLEWVDLPREGTVYAFSALLAGAPLGMEGDLPIVVGLVDLAGSPLRLFGRIVGVDWRECRIGLRVTVEPTSLADGRTFYAFRATHDPQSRLHRRE